MVFSGPEIEVHLVSFLALSFTFLIPLAHLSLYSSAYRYIHFSLVHLPYCKEEASWWYTRLLHTGTGYLPRFLIDRMSYSFSNHAHTRSMFRLAEHSRSHLVFVILDILVFCVGPTGLFDGVNVGPRLGESCQPEFRICGADSSITRSFVCWVGFWHSRCYFVGPSFPIYPCHGIDYPLHPLQSYSAIQ